MNYLVLSLNLKNSTALRLWIYVFEYVRRELTSKRYFRKNETTP